MRPTAVLGAVTALLLLAGCSKVPPAGPRIDPALAVFIPADTVQMAGARVDVIVKTPVYQKYLANRNVISRVQDLTALTGINPTKDLWELLSVSNGQQAAMLGHGMFSDEGEPKLQKKGDNRFGYKGFTLIGNDDNAILLVNQTVMATGATAELKAMVDAHEKSAGPPPAMAALLARMPSTAQIWAAYAGGKLMPSVDPRGNSGNNNLSNINKMIGLIQTGTLYLDLTNGLNGLADGTAGSDSNAEELESGLRALIGFGRLAVPPNQPDGQKIFDGLRPTREGREVKLHIDEAEDLVDKLMKMIPGEK
jgi:hypothetical protein